MDRGQSLQHTMIHLQMWPKLKADYLREDFNNTLIRKKCFLSALPKLTPPLSPLQPPIWGTCTIFLTHYPQFILNKGISLTSSSTTSHYYHPALTRSFKQEVLIFHPVQNPNICICEEIDKK